MSSKKSSGKSSRKSSRTNLQPVVSLTRTSGAHASHGHGHTHAHQGSSGSARPSSSNMEDQSCENLEKEYCDMHRIVLQGMLSAGYLDAKGVKKLFTGACTYLKLDPTQRTTMPYIQKIVRDINDKLKPFDIAIKSASCELTGVKYYIFLITTEKKVLKQQALFTKFELELFQKYLDVILRKYSSFSVSPIECINMARETKIRGTVKQAEDFIHRMINMQYFAKFVPKGNKDTNWEITLGFRGIREFEPILRDSYGDVMTKCSLCKMFLLHGYLCPSCKLLVHKSCWMRYIKSGKNCPNCKSNLWGQEDKLIVRVREEQEAEVDDDFGMQPASNQPGTPSTNIGSVDTEAMDTMDDDSSTEDMPILEPMAKLGFSSSSDKALPSTSRGTRVSRGRQVLVFSDSDSD